MKCKMSILALLFLGLGISTLGAQDSKVALNNIELAKTLIMAKKYDDAILLLQKSISNLQTHSYLLEYKQNLAGRSKSVVLKGEIQFTWDITWPKQTYEGITEIKLVNSETKEETQIAYFKTGKDPGNQSGENYIDADGKYYIELWVMFSEFSKVRISAE